MHAAANWKLTLKWRNQRARQVVPSFISNSDRIAASPGVISENHRS